MVHTLGGYSAHADRSGLLNWTGPFEQCKSKMLLTHGEDGPRTALRNQLKTRFGFDAGFGLDATKPQCRDEVELWWFLRLSRVAHFIVLMAQ